MKKICVVTNKYHPSIGGTELLTKEFVDFFKDKYEISVITNMVDNRLVYNYDYNIYQYDYNQFSNLKSMFDLKKFDLTVFFADLHTPYLNVYDNKVCRKNICILNVDERTFEIRHNFSNAILNLQKFDNVITFCKNAPVNKFLEEFRIKNTFIPNMSRDCFDSENQFILKDKFKIQNKKIITCLASYEDRKNQLSLLKNILLLNDDSYAWIFIGNVSDTSYANKCIQYVKEKKLTNIYFVQGTSNLNLVDTLLKQSDATILPSIAEGLPLSIIESMSASTPWISTPVGGVRGVFGELHSGFIFDKVHFNHEDLKKAVTQSIVKDRKIVRNEWEQNFNKNNIFKNYKNVIEEVI